LMVRRLRVRVRARRCERVVRSRHLHRRRGRVVGGAVVW
jgi:hypothetical protein